jgi:cytochrome c-type biogenesis protein CcmF
MASFGTLTLLIAFVVATYSGVASLIGVRRKNARLIESGRAGAYALAGVLGLSSVAIVYAFVTNDYSIRYVQRTSDAATPLFYKITAYWGGLDGSILWWVFLLSVFSAIAIYTNRHRHKEILPYAVAVLMVICNFFLLLILFHKNPFDTYLTQVPAHGEGLNPLLQNAYMITHPPSLYVGLVGMSIPFAFAMGALISGHLDDAWITAVRKWTLISWFFLSMGLTLGMLWAYEELGWGGFWAWDPVENAGFLPWLTATAFFHSTMIQERRGMLKVWNFTLIILTFFLTIFGTFMTRSGVVESVHAFGEDKKLAKMFSAFMVLIVVVSFGFVIKRLPELRARAKLDSLFSREAAFLFNNWILLFSMFFVLFATMFPTISEAFTGDRINVGPPFFNKWMVPIGLGLLFLTGVGPLIAWRKATTSHLRYQFTWPLTSAAVVTVVCVALGLHRPSLVPVICFGLCGFTAGTVVQEFARGAAIRRRNTGSDILTALLGMLIRGRRRYGGYLVHMGVVFMFLGFAGQAYQLEKDLRFVPGQVQPFGRYQVRFDRLTHTEDRQKEMVTGQFTVLQGDKELGRLEPARWFFVKSPQPTTEVAIRRSPAEDLYLTLGNYDFADGSVVVKLVINPLVNWIWFGFMLLAIGLGIALLPESVLAPMAVRAGVAAEGAVGRTVALLLALGVGMLVSSPALAARDPASVNADRRWFKSNLMCMCGGCRSALGDCQMAPTCHGEKEQLALLEQLLAEGKTREEIVQVFVEKYSAKVLLAPPDTGFNRLAWALPYGLGLMGAGAIGYSAWRFAKRGQLDQGGPQAAGAKAPDPDMEDRLEEELSRVD